MAVKFTLQKLRQQPLRMSKRIREHGIGNFSRWGVYQLRFRALERRLGIDTMEHAYGIDVWDRDGGQWYDPIDYQCLWDILDHMDPRPDQDVFLDYGAGLGRPIIAAAMRPFQRVIGVERDPLLLDYCQQHVASAQQRGKQCCPIEIVACDAADYVVPGEVTHILMHNTFIEQQLMDKVLARIEHSLAATPRAIALYFVPLHKHQHLLENQTFLEMSDELPTGFWNHVRIMVYQSVRSPATPVAL